MNRSAPKRDEKTAQMFDDHPLPSIEEVEASIKQIRFQGLEAPVWTEHKAKLIALYLKHFVYITKHGTYIDGFAGPQEPNAPASWSAKLALENRPAWLRHFFLCELDQDKVTLLEDLTTAQAHIVDEKTKRDIRVLPGDFNQQVDCILSSGIVTEKEATFALLDQRTFECHWNTVRKIAMHKTGAKIEIFYFLAVKWIHRALAGTGEPGAGEVAAWCGSTDWTCLKSVSQNGLRDQMRARFLDELGYKYAFAWPIFERSAAGGSVMYYMIHATDHEEAPKLMYRAYRKAVADIPFQEQMGLGL